MGIFKSNKPSKGSAMKDKVAAGLASVINKAQHRWVKAMERLLERLLERLSARTKVLLFISYLTLMFMACGYSIVKSIRNWNRGTRVELQATIPKVVLQHPSSIQLVDTADPIRNRISFFRHWVDSLNATREGKQYLDSVLKTRTGLIDSLKRVEEIYK